MIDSPPKTETPLFPNGGRFGTAGLGVAALALVAGAGVGVGGDGACWLATASRSVCLSARPSESVLPLALAGKRKKPAVLVRILGKTSQTTQLTFFWDPLLFV